MIHMGDSHVSNSFARCILARDNMNVLHFANLKRRRDNSTPHTVRLAKHENISPNLNRSEFSGFSIKWPLRLPANEAERVLALMPSKRQTLTIQPQNIQTSHSIHLFEDFIWILVDERKRSL
jgi:hypothetical protein